MIRLAFPVLGLVLFLLGPLLAYFAVVPPIVGFAVWAGSTLPALIGLVGGTVLLVRGQRRDGALALVMGLVPVGIIFVAFLATRGVPPINDISTNLDNPPQLVAAAKAPANLGRDLSYPPEFIDVVRQAYPDLISLQLPLPTDEAFALIKKVAATMPGWRITRVDETTLIIEGEDVSGMFRFVDDFVIHVVPLEGSSQVDMRSRSRVGRSDLGANAARIRRFFEAVESTLDRRRPEMP